MKKTVFLAAVLATTLTACKKPTPIYTDVDSSNEISLTEDLKAYAPQAQQFSFNSDEVIKITTAKNNVIVFPKHAFAYTGTPVTGVVNISVTEITTKSEMILSDVLTNSDQGPLESQGEFLVEAFQNNKKLELAEGASFTIESGGAYSTEMKGWTYQENPNYVADGTSQPGEWVATNNSNNNPCEVFTGLLSELEAVNPITNTEKASNVLNQISAMLKLNEDQYSITGGVNYNLWLNSANYTLNTLTTDWFCSDSTANSSFSIYGNGGQFWNTQDTSINVYVGSQYGNINSCSVSAGLLSFNFDPNEIQVKFNELGFCNIDALITQYGGLYNCEIDVKGVPSNAKVQFIFPTLNGALTALSTGNDIFEIDRLPNSMSIKAIVYYKKEGKFYFGSQMITATQNMVFDPSNIVEIQDIQELVKEIQKLN